MIRRSVHRLAALSSLVTLAACSESRATTEDCRAIFERIVELELEEMGYRDPALAERKRAELGRVLGPELQRCEGRRIASTARACIREAKTAEALTHDCFR